ncbi:MAG: hypothetical protein KC620_15690 [Myxococcales bacterium]|nr:hypothetical protein [Myxococcales bacterium]
MHTLDDYGRSYRATRRVTRWPVGTLFAGEVLPSGAPCTLVFPDILASEVEAFVRELADEVARNRLLVGLPIMGIQHAGQTMEQRAFLVLPPLIDAPSLEERIRRQGPFDPLLALQVSVLLADAVARLHYRARALGELRPWQVLLPTNRREQLRLFDLGIPRGLHRRTIAPPRVDPHFASPAVREGEAPRAADDVYSVGALLYFMLTGEPPPLHAEPLPSRQRDTLGPFGSFLDGLVLQAIRPGQARGAEAFEDMNAFARGLRGLRDLHRLSGDATRSVLVVRGPERSARLPAGAEPLPIGAVGFIESDGPSFLTQAELESIEGRMGTD